MELLGLKSRPYLSLDDLVPCTLRSSSLRGYQFTTSWWIPISESCSPPAALNVRYAAPRWFHLGWPEGIWLWHSARIFSFPPSWVTSCAALVLDIFNTKKRKRQRKRMVFHGSFCVSLIHFWAFKLILKPKVRVANRQSQGVKHIATSQFLSR